MRPRNYFIFAKRIIITITIYAASGRPRWS